MKKSNLLRGLLVLSLLLALASCGGRKDGLGTVTGSDGAATDESGVEDGTIVPIGDGTAIPEGGAVVPDGTGDAVIPEEAVVPEGEGEGEGVIGSEEPCVAETDAAFCTRLRKTCGTVTKNDNCGTLRTVVSCGTCGSNPSIACSTISNVCVFVGGTADRVDGSARIPSGSTAPTLPGGTVDGSGTIRNPGHYERPAELPPSPPTPPRP